MINSKSSYWKSALIGSAMTLIPHGAMAANKPLPCPSDSYLQDKAGVIQELTKQKVENRLRAIDSQKHHQVVVVTVDNIQEYGYNTIAQMADAIGTECKIGYRGEDTGVVVLYTKTPSRYKISTAGTQQYATDIFTGRLIDNSRLNGVCEITDVNCRLDNITDGIDKIIRKNFPDQQSVQRLKDSTQKSDSQKADRELSEFLSYLGMGIVVISVIGGSVLGGNALVRRNRRKALKRQIFELSIKFKTEKSKYPEWFNSYMYETERNLEELENSSDNDLDLIIKGGYNKIEFDENINSITDSIDGFEVKYQEIIQKVKIEEKEVKKKIQELGQLQVNLKNEGFRFGVIQIPEVKEQSNPSETLSLLEKISSELDQSIAKLKSVPDFYKSMEGLDAKVQEEYSSKEEEFKKLSIEFKDIFNQTSILEKVGNKTLVDSFIKEFQIAYSEKDINRLRKLAKQEESLLSLIDDSINLMKEKINWYNKIPSQVALRQREMGGLTVKQEYREEAKKYSQKTGNKKYDDYELGANLALLQELLKTISLNYSQKKNLGEINNSFKEFDEKYSEAKSYIGLGATLAIIIGKEIAEAQRKIEEERRREEEEERSRRRREEEDEDRRRRQRDDDDDGILGGGGLGGGGGGEVFEAGGGGGFDGGGAEGE
ncbi:TPM domain-containing protein [Candidatus Gracilibacteria bacterium]|nr:TPM domain-containing protein [Candidatus Gracilibacteria bacterium]